MISNNFCFALPDKVDKRYVFVCVWRAVDVLCVVRIDLLMCAFHFYFGLCLVLIIYSITTMRRKKLSVIFIHLYYKSLLFYVKFGKIIIYSVMKENKHISTKERKNLMKILCLLHSHLAKLQFGIIQMEMQPLAVWILIMYI